MKIEHKTEPIDASHLSSILESVGDNDLDWYLLEFDAITVPGSDQWSYSSIEEKINSSSTGFKIEWGNLVCLPRKINSLIWIYIIGIKKGNTAIKSLDDKILYDLCDVVINGFDGACWYIKCKDQSLEERIASKFTSSEFSVTDEI